MGLSKFTVSIDPINEAYIDGLAEQCIISLGRDEDWEWAHQNLEEEKIKKVFEYAKVGLASSLKPQVKTSRYVRIDVEEFFRHLMDYEGETIDAGRLALILDLEKINAVGVKLRHIHAAMQAQGLSLWEYLIPSKSAGRRCWQVRTMKYSDTLPG